MSTEGKGFKIHVMRKVLNSSMDSATSRGLQNTLADVCSGGVDRYIIDEKKESDSSE